MTRSGVFAWLLASTAVAAIPAILFLDAGAAEYGEGWFANLVGPVAILASTGVGLLLALRRHTNPIGWLLLANGTCSRLPGSRAPTRATSWSTPARCRADGRRPSGTRRDGPCSSRG